MYKYIYFLLIFCMVPFVANAQEAMKLPVDSSPLIIETASGKVEYQVEIAKTAEEREKGLMYRHDFPSERVMLFKFDTLAPVSMWMANTPLSLDMLFLDDQGIVVSTIQNATPYSLNVLSSTYPALYVIELNAGQIKKNKLAVGQRVMHKAINQDLKEK